MFQVDDINADKNVSSTQIVGECESEILWRFSQYCCLLFSHHFPSSDCFYACGILPTCPTLPKCSMVETKLRISHFQREKVYSAFKESPKLPFPVNGYHYCHFLVVHHPQVLFYFLPSSSLCSCCFNCHCAWKYQKSFWIWALKRGKEAYIMSEWLSDFSQSMFM